MSVRADLFDDDMPTVRLRRSKRVPVAIAPSLIALLVSGLVVASILNIESAPDRAAQDAPGPQAATAKELFVPPLDPAVQLAISTTAFGSSMPLAAAFVPPSEPAQLASAEDFSPPVVAALPLVMPQQELSPVVQDVPLPTPRPPKLGSVPTRPPFRTDLTTRFPSRSRIAAAEPPADHRSFFERLFGVQPQPPGPVLAYAAPEDDAVRRPSAATPFSADRYTAVYDIEAHTVFMPDGGRLEAHSGLGDRLDDPRFVQEKNRGATPPHVYDLEPRAQLFHGVRALRLNPVGGGTVFGRTGLLAHTFMLGPNGDSNGCVSFRNYNAFLQAYLSGEVKRLAVVVRRS